jgi:predicted metal-dependent hydrolase
MALDWEHGALAEGLACYRRQEFFSTHEHWESEWVHAAEPEKTFLQALIHISVAMHHHQCGNVVGARRQLARSLHKLAAYPAEFGGIEAEPLRQDIKAWLQALEAADPATSLPAPKIR